LLSLYLSLLENEKDKDKLEHIYNEYYDFMIRAANKYISNIHDNYDIVHDSILKIIKYIDKIDINEPKQAKSYIYLIVKSTALDFLKKHDNKNLSIDEFEEEYDYVLKDEDSENHPLEYIINKDGYEKLVGYIMKLNDTLRLACELKYIHNLKESEIADILNITPKNAGVRISRGRSELKKMILEGRGNDE